MAIAVDLHSHSSYAGGAGSMSLPSLAETMRYKGIDVFGIGDCQFPLWQNQYKEMLKKTPGNLYHLPGTKAHFLLQTEVIFTVSLADRQHKTIAHHLILFPDAACVSAFQKWMQKKGIKNTIARPFIVTGSQNELLDCLYEIQSIHDWIEIIPAHILTPDGILGSKNNLTTWHEFYGDFSEHIHAVETGLSADPQMLAKIPDLQGRAFLSNSDCHSSALNKVGREFTLLETDDMSYYGVVRAIRDRRIRFTAEFHPTEGRYYLTGHRAGRHADQESVFYPDMPPSSLSCPLCGKVMLKGVRDRAQELSDSTLHGNFQPFRHLLPLVEVISCALHLKNVSSPKVLHYYQRCIDAFTTEINLWQSDERNIHELLDNNLPQEIIQHMIAVRRGNFNFNPPGFDGSYGVLNIQME